jgi:cyclopropane-fatty-acyl-phospholipid synthase
MSTIIDSPSSRVSDQVCYERDVSPRCLRERFARRAVLARLRGLTHGEIKLVEGGKRHVFGKPTESCPLRVELTVERSQFFPRSAFGGDIGAAESFMDGDWSCDNLTDLVRILIVNSQAQATQPGWIASLFEPLYRAAHWLNRNTRRGSRKNIAAHYDLGNDFFELLLDETRMYSCGIFERSDSSLFDASTAKNERICQKLELKPQDHLLEIGTGWGGFALHAAKNYGCRVTTTTISHEQYTFAKKRIADAGLSERVTVLMQDYRDLTGEYDKLVSIEMIEAVGHEFFDEYFRTCSRLLKPEGLFVLQGITIADQLYSGYVRRVDFIQRYIFPGGCLPSVTRICEVLTRSTDLRMSHLEDFAGHYAQTLRHWRARFQDRINDVKRLGFDERFMRMWDYYLCYCEGAFLERNCGLAQILLTKPGYRNETIRA